MQVLTVAPFTNKVRKRINPRINYDRETFGYNSNSNHRSAVTTTEVVQGETQSLSCCQTTYWYKYILLRFTHPFFFAFIDIYLQLFIANKASECLFMFRGLAINTRKMSNEYFIPVSVYVKHISLHRSR
uniref:Uncharacterized protein n=1 Tax=Glossina brevipalpis TaxID=37001 RepID=A0A1A9X2Y9_9MUSC